jgi:predicted nucleotidyltransferase
VNRPQLEEAELALVRNVFCHHPEVASVVLFGSRAKGTSHAHSDVDLAIEGDITPLQAEAIAGELDDLPLPYRFDVQPLARISHKPLRDHIDRVGICIYRAA